MQQVSFAELFPFVQDLTPRLRDVDALEGIHVWKIELHQKPAAYEGLQDTLSADEQKRACQFVFDKDRRRFVLTRGVLRHLLGSELRESPERLRFDHNSSGKPWLAEPWHASSLEFNVSHSGDWALIALARGRRVGVDVEQIRPLAELEAIAQRHFSPWETAELRGMTPGWQQRAFFRCWTCKEACLKGLGCGITQFLDAFDVSLALHEAPAIVSSRCEELSSDRWRLCGLEVADGYAAVLAAEQLAPR